MQWNKVITAIDLPNIKKMGARCLIHKTDILKSIEEKLNMNNEKNQKTIDSRDIAMLDKDNNLTASEIITASENVNEMIIEADDREEK